MSRTNPPPPGTITTWITDPPLVAGFKVKQMSGISNVERQLQRPLRLTPTRRIRLHPFEN